MPWRCAARLPGLLPRTRCSRFRTPTPGWLEARSCSAGSRGEAIPGRAPPCFGQAGPSRLGYTGHRSLLVGNTGSVWFAPRENVMCRQPLWQRGWVLFLLSLVAGLGALPAADPDKPAPPEFSEHLIQDGYGYAYGLAAADIDGDGHLDLVSSD